MAEGLLKQKLPDDIKDYVIVRSAGTLNIVGNRATPFAIAAAMKYQAKISNHHSQALSPQLVYDSDVVLVMDTSHQAYIDQEFPAAQNFTFLLKEFDRQGEIVVDKVIIDPIGSSLSFYEATCAEINTELERILPTLTKQIKEKMNRTDEPAKSE